MALKDFEAQTYRCSNCAGCKFIPFDKVQSTRFSENCPSIGYYNFHTYSARGRYFLTRHILEGRVDFSDKTVEVIKNCMSCGACDIACKITRYNLDVLDHNIELKAAAVEKGKVLPQQQDMMESLKNEKTMITGMKKADRGNWSKGLKVKTLPEDKAEVVFFPGCKYSYAPELQKTARDSVNLLINAGVDVGILGNADGCCGSRAYQMGFFDDFNHCAVGNIKAFEAAGAKVIVTPCSDCYHAFKRQYAKLGLKVEVLHTIEYIDRLVKEGKLKFTNSIPMKVTYHDPCHLGRLGEPYVPWEGKEKKIRGQIHTWEPKKPRYAGTYGIYDAPRDVLKSIPGITLVEMERIREYSWCCGSGAGVSETNPEFSNWTAGERIKEAYSTGADALITACPWCESNFNIASGEDGKKIKVLDILKLVQQAI